MRHIHSALSNTGCLFAVTALSALLFGSAESAVAAPIVWQKDLAQTVNTSTTTNKPMLVKIGAAWCGYCKKMDRVAFADPKVIDHVNDCFVPVSLDADHNKRLVRELAVESLPTTLIVSPQMKVLARLTGYKTANQLVTEIGKICSPKPQQQIKPAAAKVTEPTLGFDAVCLVSLLDDRKLAAAKPAITSTVRGVTIGFASAEHKQKFDANPMHYWPMMDGVCLVTYGDGAKVSTGKAEFGLHYKDRVWLFSGETEQQKFIDNPDHYIRMVETLRAAMNAQSRR